MPLWLRSSNPTGWGRRGAALCAQTALVPAGAGLRKPPAPADLIIFPLVFFFLPALLIITPSPPLLLVLGR
jgi:hypothetical protein